jgi:hypothetical protein
MFRNLLVKASVLNLFSTLLVLTLLLLVSSCARKVRFGISPVVPTAEGTVKVKKDKNNNYALKVDIKHLAEPNRLPEPKNVYVVWVETERNGIQNLGQLNTSSGLISSTLRASMETVTPYKPTRLFITAEDEAAVQYPGAQVVLSTNL